MSTKLKVRIGGRWYTVEVGDLQSSPLRVLVDGAPVEVRIEDLLNDATSESQVEPAGVPTADRGGRSGGLTAGAKVFASPMPGVILSVAVKAGDQLVTGDEICILEAMKMQQTLRADWSGIVKAVHVEPGQQVLDGDPIVELG